MFFNKIYTLLNDKLLIMIKLKWFTNFCDTLYHEVMRYASLQI